MFVRIRKSITVILLLWLPLFSASVMAQSLAMQLQRGDCHEFAQMMSMSHDNMMDHGMMHHETTPASDEENSSCTSCAICHVACSAFLDVATVAMHFMASASQAVSSTPETFVSHLSPPLLRPPLVAA